MNEDTCQICGVRYDNDKYQEAWIGVIMKTVVGDSTNGVLAFDRSLALEKSSFAISVDYYKTASF